MIGATAFRRAQGRALAFAILAALILLVWLLLVRPLLAVLEAPRAEIAVSTRLLAGYEAQAAKAPALGARLAELRSRSAQSAGLIEGDSAEVAAAGIQEAVKAIIEAAGGEIRSSGAERAEIAGSYEKIAVRYELSVPAEQLDDALYAIESRTPYLFIEDLTARSSDSHPRREGESPNFILETSLTISGYRWAPPQ